MADYCLYMLWDSNCSLDKPKYINKEEEKKTQYYTWQNLQENVEG